MSDWFWTAQIFLSPHYPLQRSLEFWKWILLFFSRKIKNIQTKLKACYCGVSFEWSQNSVVPKWNCFKKELFLIWPHLEKEFWQSKKNTKWKFSESFVVLQVFTNNLQGFKIKILSLLLFFLNCMQRGKKWTISNLEKDTQCKDYCSVQQQGRLFLLHKNIWELLNCCWISILFLNKIERIGIEPNWTFLKKVFFLIPLANSFSKKLHSYEDSLPFFCWVEE